MRFSILVPGCGLESSKQLRSYFFHQRFLVNVEMYRMLVFQNGLFTYHGLVASLAYNPRRKLNTNLGAI